ncbi:MAG: hypothetical protein VW421_00800 [Gammaproteobacteria bacterium]
MKTPPSKHPDLSSLLDRHTSHGLLPCVNVLNHFAFEQDFKKLFNNLKIDVKLPGLIIGGRTFPEAMNFCDNFLLFDDRERFLEYNLKFNRNRFTVSLSSNHIAESQIIFIYAEYIAEVTKLSPLISEINSLIDSNIRFFVVTKNWDRNNSAGFSIEADGARANWPAYEKWFDHVRSHMHLGIKQYSFEVTNFFDLTYEYPLLDSPITLNDQR